MSRLKVWKLFNLAADDGLILIGFAGNSYFRIGLEWTKAALFNGWQLIQQVCFTSYRDPETVWCLLVFRHA